MIFLLDTDICIYTLNGGTPTLEKNFRRNANERMVVSTLTEAELHYEAINSSRPEKNHERIEAFLAPFEKCPFDSSAAREFADIKKHLLRQGHPIGVIDMLIAAIAKSVGATVVTNNLRHFHGISGLKAVSWI